jgi:hypothetical protein
MCSNSFPTGKTSILWMALRPRIKSYNPRAVAEPMLLPFLVVPCVALFFGEGTDCIGAILIWLLPLTFCDDFHSLLRVGATATRTRAFSGNKAQSILESTMGASVKPYGTTAIAHSIFVGLIKDGAFLCLTIHSTIHAHARLLQ